MNATLNAISSVAALLLAAVAALWAALNRPVPGWQLVGAAAVEAIVIAVVGDAVGRIAGGHRPHELATYIGYLIALLLIVPAAPSSPWSNGPASAASSWPSPRC